MHLYGTINAGRLCIAFKDTPVHYKSTASKKRAGCFGKFFYRSCIWFNHRTMHSAGAFCLAWLCRLKAKCFFWYESFVFICLRYGYNSHYSGNICRPACQYTQIRHMDDKSKPHLWLDIAWYGRIFSHNGGNFLDIKEWG